MKSVDVSENFPPLYSGQITEARALTKDNPNLLTFAIIASNTKEFLNDDRNKCENIPIGYLAQKVQQLELLGFHPIVVSNFDFFVLILIISWSHLNSSDSLLMIIGYLSYNCRFQFDYSDKMIRRWPSRGSLLQK